MWVGTALHWAGVEAAKPTQLFVHKHSFNQKPPKNYEKKTHPDPKISRPPVDKRVFCSPAAASGVARSCLPTVSQSPSWICTTSTKPHWNNTATILIHLLSLSAMLNISINLTDRCQIFGHREVFSSGHLGFLWEAK